MTKNVDTIVACRHHLNNKLLPILLLFIKVPQRDISFQAMDRNCCKFKCRHRLWVNIKRVGKLESKQLIAKVEIVQRSHNKATKKVMERNVSSLYEKVIGNLVVKLFLRLY